MGETLTAAASLSQASFNVQGPWGFSPVCWLESWSVLERPSPQWIFQNSALYPNSNLKSCSSQAKHEERAGPMTKQRVLPPWASQHRETRSTHTQRAKIHFEPISALNSGVMHISIHFLSFILNFMITVVEENTQP